MYNFCIIEKKNIEKSIEKKVFNEINELFNNAIFLLYENGKLYLHDDYRNLDISNRKVVEKSGYQKQLLEADFTNKGHFSAVEIYFNKISKKKVVCELEIASIIALDPRLDNYVSGVSRMFNLPYFGNDFYLSTLLNDPVFQSINLKQNNVLVHPYMWFYFHDFKKLNAKMQSFLDNNKNKKIILSPIEQYYSDNKSIQEVSTIEEIEAFVLENTKTHFTTKYIMKAFPQKHKKVFCINNVVIGDVSNEHKNRIDEIFYNVFKTLGQETLLFGIEFSIDKDEIFITKLLSIIDIFVNRTTFKDILSESNFEKFVQSLKDQLLKIYKERQNVFYANNRRQFVFQSKILDDVEGGKS